MSKRVVVDPVTRIEGHLRIEADVQNGKITDAFSSGTAIRGIELVVRNRDPRDVWGYVQRICGVCTSSHALASIRAVEDALDIRVPKNASLIRNIMNGTLNLHDHVVHFYHLHAFDWVDALSILKADPKETSRIAQSISAWPNSSPGYFKSVQDKIKKVADSGQLGVFANGYWGHPAYKLPPEVNLLAVAHYLEALDWQKEIVKIQTILGGKNPHPHYLVGGMATPLDINMDNGIHSERLQQIDQLITQADQFIHQVYLPDLLAIGSYYKDWGSAEIGGGLRNYLCYGDFSTGDIRDTRLYRVPRGIIMNGNMNDIQDVDLHDPKQITEGIDHAWYTYGGSQTGSRHPWKGSTELNYTGPKPPYEHLNTNEKYSWIKAPRWRGQPMETGPLARMIVGYAADKGDYRPIVDDTLKKLGLPLTALHSALGRTVARGLDAGMIVGWMREDFNSLIQNIKNGDQTTFDKTKWEPKSWPKHAFGAGTSEAPRGALGHWIEIENGKTKNYQAVVPTTWNASPRDSQGNIGAYESSLKGVPVADLKQPLEILRVVHSFDPCLACAVHLTDTESRTLTSVHVE
ncbi:nickel-dependent hydrogenase large subunit [Sporolactobacillus sp. THM19-2]|uniref:nickel-dependent hydrogenase large subunit n=1 Tax=Sporolactobacillus sp. THM19-2 TaxID=2511171 RepID=UPI0010228F6A|nr:nickel-dependent hydrogenase large subunit [Sporolactobacillus sp. THM19-2]RYL93615.1 nickel-dependent hydrogenase large subunit [Sporolactobacillus sp. THM19-2]